jgi:hypothetical protein
MGTVGLLAAGLVRVIHCVRRPACKELVHSTLGQPRST